MNNSTDSDDFSRIPVADGNLRPWWYLMTLELGLLISIPLFVIGGQIGTTLTLSNLILATFIGGAILGVISALTARIGAVTRCSTALLARATFGSNGATCIGLLLALGMTGWWAVQTEMFATAVIDLVRTLFHLSLDRHLTILLAGSAMITTAALGIRAMGRLAYVAVPLLATCVCYGLFTVLSNNGLATAISYKPPDSISVSLGSAIATIVGMAIVGVSMNPDFARFARNTKHAVAYATVHCSFNYPLMMTLCGFMAMGFGSKDLLIHLVPPQASWLLLILMMLATWAANDCNLYSSSLGLTAVIPGLKRSILACAAGLIGMALAEFCLVDKIVSFLVLIGTFIAPISGVFVVGAVDPRDSANPNKIAEAPKWRYGALVSWLSGITIGWITTPRAALGFGLLELTTVPALDAILAAAAVMYLVKLFSKEQQPIASTPERVASEHQNYRIWHTKRANHSDARGIATSQVHTRD
jgi:cytosine permease